VEQPAGAGSEEVVYADYYSPLPSVEPSRQREPVYSANDGDVRPPLPLRPTRFTTEVPAGAASEALTKIEVVVGTSGEVASAKIVAGPRTYTDGMLLSAVKASKFVPAMKDRQPVPYRQIVWWAPPSR